jgi:hypothetical protein
MKFQELMESYGMIKKEQRMFYPKNFNLSEKFLKTLHEELSLQEKSGVDAKAFTTKLNRALQFHIDDYNKNKSNKKPLTPK